MVASKTRRLRYFHAADDDDADGEQFAPAACAGRAGRGSRRRRDDVDDRRRDRQPQNFSQRSPSASPTESVRARTDVSTTTEASRTAAAGDRDRPGVDLTPPVGQSTKPSAGPPPDQGRQDEAQAEGGQETRTGRRRRRHHEGATLLEAGAGPARKQGSLPDLAAAPPWRGPANQCAAATPPASGTRQNRRAGPTPPAG